MSYMREHHECFFLIPEILMVREINSRCVKENVIKKRVI